MRFNRRDRAIWYALAAVGLWSTVATAFKISLRYLSPEALLFYASWTSLAFFALVLWRNREFGEVRSLAWRHWKSVLLLGTINPFVYYLTLFHAYDLLPAQEAQAINYSWGILLALLSAPILHQKLRRKDLLPGHSAIWGFWSLPREGICSPCISIVCRVCSLRWRVHCSGRCTGSSIPDYRHRPFRFFF